MVYVLILIRKGANQSSYPGIICKA